MGGLREEETTVEVDGFNGSVFERIFNGVSDSD